MRGLSITPLVSPLPVNGSGSSAAVNVGNYHGLCLLHLNASASNAGTSTLKVQHSESGTADWDDVTGGAFTPVGTSVSEQTLMINADKLRKFIRVNRTLAGGATVITYSVVLVGKKQYS